MAGFDLVKNFTDKQWLESVEEKLRKKMRYAVEKSKEGDFIPYSTQNGAWKRTDIIWWTNGFWPATMWQMHRMTGESLYREEALRAEKMLDAAQRDFKTMSHDAGFMWLIHSGVRYALEKNADSYDRTLYAAQMLACRYNPNGFIRAWNGEGRQGWAIVDCMMNLPLLYWASHITGDPRYRLMAERHAMKTAEYFVRPDGSCNHIVIFDAETGEFIDNPAGQGYASGSSWSRGQAWALYGFTLSYLWTGNPFYLDVAKRVAHYFISSVTEDWIPRCDFRQPANENLKDNTGGMVAVCGLMEIARAVPEAEAKTYFDAAVNMLRAMEKTDINWQNDDPALLTRCTAAYHDIPSHHMTMNYADYFFIEAVNKLRGDDFLFWKPVS